MSINLSLADLKGQTITVDLNGRITIQPVQKKKRQASEKQKKHLEAAREKKKQLKAQKLFDHVQAHKLFQAEKVRQAQDTFEKEGYDSDSSNQTQVGSLFRGDGTPEVYFVETNNGPLRHIPDPDTFNTMGLQWENIKVIPLSELRKMHIGRPFPIHMHSRWNKNETQTQIRKEVSVFCTK